MQFPKVVKKSKFWSDVVKHWILWICLFEIKLINWSAMNADELCNGTTEKLFSNIFGSSDNLGRFLKVRKSSNPTLWTNTTQLLSALATTLHGFQPNELNTEKHLVIKLWNEAAFIQVLDENIVQVPLRPPRIWRAVGSNSGLRGDKRATNSVHLGMARRYVRVHGIPSMERTHSGSLQFSSQFHILLLVRTI